MGVACPLICSSGTETVLFSGRQQRAPTSGKMHTAARPRGLRPAPLHRQCRSSVVRAFNGSDSGGKAIGSVGGGGYRGGLDPSLEMAVPSDQRPVNELGALRQAALYSWVRLATPNLRVLFQATALS